MAPMIVRVLACVMAVVLVANAAIAPRSFGGLQRLVKGGSSGSSEQDECKCMNWRHCHGEINSDVQCAQSYVMVCCIQPRPEEIPEFIPEVSRV